MTRFGLASSLVVLAAAPGLAAVQTITNDTYVDSYVSNLGDNTHTNYGASQVVKAVTSAASTAFPAPSVVHTLFTLPTQFWNDLGSQQATSVVVQYNTKTNQMHGRDVELHPLTHAFVAGTGGSPSASQGGTANTDAAPIGADYTSYDGKSADTWTTPGGDFDAAHFVLTQNGTAGTAFTWDITALVNNPLTRAEIQSDGLYLRTVNEGDLPNPQDFASLFSGDSASGKPTVTYSVVPEPASLATLGGLVLLTLRRRKQA